MIKKLLPIFIVAVMPVRGCQENLFSPASDRPYITLINSTDNTVDIPRDLACKCDVLKRMLDDSPQETILPVDQLSQDQLGFMKDYLMILDKGCADADITKLNGMSMEQLAEGLRAANFLDLKPKKPIVTALLAQTLSVPGYERYLQQGSYNLDLPEEMMRKIRKHYASSHVFRHWFTQAQRLKPDAQRTAVRRVCFSEFPNIEKIQYSPDGKIIAQIQNSIPRKGESFDGRTRVLLIHTDTHQTEFLRNSDGPIEDISWSPCSTRLACCVNGFNDGCVTLLNAEQNHVLTSDTIPHRISCMTWHPKDNCRYALAVCRTILIRDIEKRAIVATYEHNVGGHHEGVRNLEWNQTGTALLSTQSNTVNLFDIRAQSVVKAWHDSNSILSLKCNPHNEHSVAIGTLTNLIIFKDLRDTGDAAPPLHWMHKNSPFIAANPGNDGICHLAWHPTDPFIASLSRINNSVKIWDTHTLKCHSSISTEPTGANVIATSSHGHGLELAVGSRRGTFIVDWYDHQFKKTLLDTMTLEEIALQQLAFDHPETIDVSAPALHTTWHGMNPSLRQALLNTFPYKQRLTSWLKNTLWG